MKYNLTIGTHGDVVVSYTRANAEMQTRIHNIKQWNFFFNNERRYFNCDLDAFKITASSAVDAPQKFTKKKDALAICEMLKQ